jgi:hypothetical protein
MGGVLVLLGLAYWAGGKQHEPTAHAQTTAPTATATATATASTVTKSRDPFDTSALDGLGTKLATEKANAGKSDPNASSVFAAIQKDLKLTLSDKMQPLAAPVGAQYCERMNTKNDVYVVVCEFESEESAKLGQKKATHDVLKRREVLQKRASTCAVHQVGDSKEAADEAKRIKDLFRAL